MKNFTKIQWAGLVIIVLSLAAGFAGTSWNIYSSFDSLPSAETNGIDVIGYGIRNAIFFSAGGLTAVIIGLILLIFGRAKR